MKPRPASRCIRSQRGFTLLELLLSMTLTALLLGMLSAGVYSVVNDWQDESAGLEDELDQALALLQVERALQGAFPHTYIDRERNSRFIYFQGEPERLRFVSTASPQRQDALSAWELYHEPGRGVMLRLAAALSDDPGARLDAARPVLLLPDHELRIHYLLLRGIDQKEWQEEWDAGQLQSLPLAVWLQWVPDDRSQPSLDLVAPIRANRHAEIEPNLPAL